MLADEAYRHIRELLASGRMRPGHKLSETRIAGALGISRTPVREAIKRLVSEGMLEQSHGSGTYLRMHTPEEMREIFTVREALESTGATLAATNASDRQREAMRECGRQMYAALREARDHQIVDMTAEVFDTWSQADRRLHRLIFEAARNRLLQRIAEDAQLLTRAYFQVDPRYFDVLATLTGAYREHRRIINTVCSGNPEAARQAMIDHVRGGYDRYIRQYAALHADR